MHFRKRFRTGVAVCSFSAGARVRGALAGNGGMMAVAKNEKMGKEQTGSKRTCPRKKGTESTTGSDTGSRAGSATENETTAKPEEDAKPKKRVRGNGAVLLKEAADKLLLKNFDELAGLVLKNAKEGRTDSTKLLVSLSEGNMPSKVPEKKRRRRGPYQADMLAQEPEWKGTPDSEVDTGFGGREPEV